MKTSFLSFVRTSAVFDARLITTYCFLILTLSAKTCWGFSEHRVCPRSLSLEKHRRWEGERRYLRKTPLHQPTKTPNSPSSPPSSSSPQILRVGDLQHHPSFFPINYLLANLILLADGWVFFGKDGLGWGCSFVHRAASRGFFFGSLVLRGCASFFHVRSRD